MTKLVQQYVALGACYEDDDVFQKCAYELSDCSSPANDTFIPSFDITKRNDTASMFCYDKSKNGIQLDFHGGTQGLFGRCTHTNDSVECTNKAQSCEFPSKFKENDKTCTLHHDLVSMLGMVENTLFPVCQNTDARVCVWSEDDCLRDELGLFSAAIHNECDCSNVQTGACLHDDAFHCVTSSLSCGASGSVYFGIRDLLTGGIDCRLCKGENNFNYTDGILDIMPEEFIVTAEPSQQPSSSPTASPTLKGTSLPPVSRPSREKIPQYRTKQPTPWSTIFPTFDTKSMVGNNNNNSIQNAPLAGLIIGIALSIFIGIGMCLYACMQKTKGSMKIRKNRRPRESFSTSLTLLPDGSETMKDITKIDEANVIK